MYLFESAYKFLCIRNSRIFPLVSRVEIAKVEFRRRDWLHFLARICARALRSNDHTPLPSNVESGFTVQSRIREWILPRFVRLQTSSLAWPLDILCKGKTNEHSLVAPRNRLHRYRDHAGSVEMGRSTTGMRQRLSEICGERQRRAYRCRECREAGD